MKRMIAIFLALIMVLSLCACGSSSKRNSSSSSSTSSEKEDTKNTTASDAIDRVKKGDYVTNAKYEIKTDLGLKEAYQPDWGTCTAEQRYDGSWSVTLCGTISGYMDDYHSDRVWISFEYKVNVDEDGYVHWSWGSTTKH